MHVLLRLAIGLCFVVIMSLLSENLIPIESTHGLSASDSYDLTMPQAAIVALLARPDVQRELVIDDLTKERLNECLLACNEKMLAMSSLIETSGLCGTSEGRIERCDAFFRKCHLSLLKDLEEQLRDILTAQQLARLKQVQLQREGLLAFRRIEVATALQLTKFQLQKIETLPPHGFLSLASAKERSNAVATLLDIFTSTQQTAWLKLKGDDFSFRDSRDDRMYVYLGAGSNSPVEMAAKSSPREQMSLLPTEVPQGDGRRQQSVPGDQPNRPPINVHPCCQS